MSNESFVPALSTVDATASGRWARTVYLAGARMALSEPNGVTPGRGDRAGVVPFVPAGLRAVGPEPGWVDVGTPAPDGPTDEPSDDVGTGMPAAAELPAGQGPWAAAVRGAGVGGAPASRTAADNRDEDAGDADIGDGGGVGHGGVARVDWVRAAVDRYERPLTSYAAHVLAGDVDRARDLVQEAFLRLCDQDPAAVGGHLAEWLYTVCRNLAIDQRRKDRRLRPMSDAQRDAFPAGREGPTAAAERADAYGRVSEAVAALPTRQQEIVRLKFQHGLSYKEIGQVMNLTATNVGFILHTAIKSLRTRFGVVGDAGIADDRGPFPRVARDV